MTGSTNPPVPEELRLTLASSVRRPSRRVLVGGSPLRLFRLTATGADQIDRWAAGAPVGSRAGTKVLARRLLDAGVAHPVPFACPHPGPADATVVIPVRNRPTGAAATVASLGASGPVIIVDDGSDDPDAVARAAGPDDTVVRRERAGGPASARNAGWQRAATSLVVFLDADCVAVPGWLEPVLAHFADPAVAAVAPRVVSDDPPGDRGLLGPYERARSPLDMGEREGVVRPGSPVAYVPTAALAVRRAALVDVGGFDDALTVGEDVDLVWRLAARGWTVRYEPASVVRHPRRTNVGDWLRQRYSYGLSAAPLAARHGRAVAPLSASRWSVGVWILLVGGHPFAAVAMAIGTSAALARRAGNDRPAARTLASLALRGHAQTGIGLADAVRRAWLPPAVIAVTALTALTWRRGARFRPAPALALGAALALPIVEWWTERPEGLGLAAWTVLRTADDFAYQAGVWTGVFRERSPAALLPRW